MRHYIYKIESPTGKIYIGQTINMYGRFNAYKNCNCKSQPKLFNSIKKYGWSNFKVDAILITENKYIDFYERIFIKFYNSVDMGLNCEYGGNKNKTLSEETRSKIRKSRVGKYAGKNHPMFGKKRPDMAMKTGENNSMYGKTHSPEYKKMMSDRMSGENHPFYGKKRPDVSENNKNKCKSIDSYDKKGNFIKNFKSIRDASKELDCWNISKVLKGKLKYTNGYTFKYEGEIS